MMHFIFTYFNVTLYNNHHSKLNSFYFYFWIPPGWKEAKCWKVVHPKHDIWMHVKTRYIYHCWRQVIVTSYWRWNVDFLINPYICTQEMIIMARYLLPSASFSNKDGINQRCELDMDKIISTWNCLMELHYPGLTAVRTWVDNYIP